MTKRGQHYSEMTTKKLLFMMVLGVGCAVAPILQLWEAEAVSWLALGVGFLMFTLLLSEYTANTTFGQRIDSWWRRIGVGGRITAIIGAAVVIWGSIWFLQVAIIPLLSFVLGGFLSLVLKSLAEITQRATIATG